MDFAIQPAQNTLDKQIIQSAVNISEGRDVRLMDQIAEIAAEHCLVADQSADPDHNRMVITVLGSPEEMSTAVVAITEVAVRQIDLNNHKGIHPRIGAVDVVPLTPIRNISMAECVELSYKLGSELADRFQLPVYFYEESAKPGRVVDLPTLRRGGFEAVRESMLIPDVGPNRRHPTAGAVVVGARSPLVAWNIWLKTDDEKIAKKIAARIRKDRDFRPELAGVRALGLYLQTRQQTQISMNVSQPLATPMVPIFDFVARIAEECGTAAVESEIIGLIPVESLGEYGPGRILWSNFKPSQLISTWLHHFNKLTRISNKITGAKI
ncbi:MAG: glutamate formimidoyltransferase [Chthonomonadales bacterium]